MENSKYDLEAELIVKIIDIAIHSFTNYPPDNFEEKHIRHVVDVYLNYKSDVVNPEPKFHNLTSLNQTREQVLTYFQEGSGKTVDFFWSEINKNGLPIKRVNRFEKILKRGKIKNHSEYDIIIDLYNSYIMTNMLSKKDIDNINSLIWDFEQSK